MNIEKAKMLDAILLKFNGNATVYWKDIREGSFDDIQSYYVIENNINFLVGDGQLNRNKYYPDTLNLTDKGFATMTDLENLGYVTAVKKERRNSRWAIISGVVVVLTFLILIYDTWVKPERFQKSTTPESINPIITPQKKDSVPQPKKDTTQQPKVNDTTKKK